MMLEVVMVLTDRPIALPCMKRALVHVMYRPTKHQNTPPFSVVILHNLFLFLSIPSEWRHTFLATIHNERLKLTRFKQTVYATHLANLVPSTHRPHRDVIRGFLERANLPDEVVAFAACVLDALSERFASTWREALGPAEFERDLKNFLRTDDSQCNTHVSPNVVVLAALSLAHGFLVDRLRSSRHWSVKESGGMFSIKEIEATKRAILQDMDYGLFRIGNDMVKSMLEDMKRPKTMTSLVRESKHDRRRTLSINLSGAAIWSHGQQTPEPSP
jgi:hypothetical protein